jgi:hypothetical protein
MIPLALLPCFLDDFMVLKCLVIILYHHLVFAQKVGNQNTWGGRIGWEFDGSKNYIFGLIFFSNHHPKLLNTITLPPGNKIAGIILFIRPRVKTIDGD